MFYDYTNCELKFLAISNHFYIDPRLVEAIELIL